jgi:hypothetical protein
MEGELEACVKSEEIFDEACGTVGAFFERFDASEGEGGEVDLFF